MKIADNSHPYIIAVGKSNNEAISYYFIEIEKHLMCVSNNFVIDDLIFQFKW